MITLLAEAYLFLLYIISTLAGNAKRRPTEFWK